MKNKKLLEKKFFALIFFAAFAAKMPLFAGGSPRGGQTLFPPRHWIYDSLQILEQEAGIVQFSDQGPLSISQIRSMLLEIDEDALSEAGRSHYEKILEHFSETQFSASASVMQARIEPALNLELYAKTNDSVPWVYDRFEKKKFLELPITLGAGDWATLFVDVAAALNKTAMNKNGTFINVPYNEYNFDVNFPHDAYGSFGVMFSESCGMNFRISNMAQSFGRADTGSIIQSEFLTDATNASFTIFSPMVQYSAAITAFNTDRYMYSHKVDIRFGKKKKVQFSLMEACLPYGPMDLRFFNPMMFLHNYAAWLDYWPKESDVGSFLAAKLNVAPAKFVRLYGLWAMTQFQLPLELDDDESNPDNLVPNAMGWQAGAESYIPLSKGHLRLNLEGYYATPYLYINSSPNWSFVRTSKESNSATVPFYEWLGTRYGPDTAAVTISAKYEVPKKWSAAASYLFLARGELSDPAIFERAGWGPRVLDGSLGGWVYPFYPQGSGNDFERQHINENSSYKNGREKRAPSGTAEFANVISLCGTYDLNEWLSFFLQPSIAIIANSGHEKGKTEFSFECVLSGRIKFAKMSKGSKNAK